MKKIVGGAVLLAALFGCSDDPSGPGSGIAGRYELVSLGGIEPPFTSIHELEGAPGVMCVDSAYSYAIQLRSSGTGTMETEQKTFCTGRSPVESGGTIPNTWTARGDSVFITFLVDTPVGGSDVTWNGALEGKNLVFRYPIYTEADPTGSSGRTYDILYRRTN